LLEKRGEKEHQLEKKAEGRAFHDTVEEVGFHFLEERKG